MCGLKFELRCQELIHYRWASANGKQNVILFGEFLSSPINKILKSSGS